MVPEGEYSLARAGVLGSFLARRRIYRTTYYAKHFEEVARKNNERAMARLHI
jgi:predicted metal-dependent HD superfamily phosphohydrolase